MARPRDQVARRGELSDAVWRVIQRDGLERASVRNVAREAHLSMGSLRYYFNTQSELLTFAMHQVIDRITGRIGEVDWSGDPRHEVDRILGELLPLDAERHVESEVWLAFTARALVDPDLRALRDEGYDLLHRVCLELVTRLCSPEARAGQRADAEPEATTLEPPAATTVDAGPQSHVKPNLDVELEAERLYALVDGLLIHRVVRPDHIQPAHIRRVLDHHLDELAELNRPQGGPG